MFESWIFYTAIGALIVAAVVAYNHFILKVIVEATEIVFVVQKGVRSAPLGTGVHRFLWMDMELHRFDKRVQELKVPGQELLTRDRVATKVTALVRYTIKDAHLLLDSSNHWYGLVYSEVQLAVRDAVALFELDELLDGRLGLNERVQGPLVTRLEALGLEMKEALIMDVMLGGDLKRAMSQVAQARAEGKAKLEQARAETASLRSLANAARMLKDNAGLLDLRTLQVAEKAARGMSNTLVLGVDPKGLGKA